MIILDSCERDFCMITVKKVTFDVRRSMMKMRCDFSRCLPNSSFLIVFMLLSKVQEIGFSILFLLLRDI